VAAAVARLEGKMWDEYTRKELTIKFLPLVENIARKFSTSQQASGVMTIMDLIQSGSLGLVQAVRKLDYEKLQESEDMEKTLKSFFSKRIKGSIRRQIDSNRGSIRIPEHKLNEIRKNFGKDKKMVEMFFNSVFLSIDAHPSDDDMVYQIPDNSEPYNTELLNIYLMGLLRNNLDKNEYEVLRLSYGLDCKKHSATEIAKELGINGSSSYVRVSQLKKQAVDKLIENVDHSQVLDYL
jgi:RNA polymerase sigma factor (sigma-70 family)